MELVAEEDCKRTYELEDGSRIVIELDPGGFGIEVFTDEEERIGEFVFDEDILDGATYLQFMDLSGLDGKYKRKGIGREALRFHKEVFGPIFAARVDGFKRGDGSHLTGEGIPFITAMRGEGIIEPLDDAPPDEYEEPYHD